MKIGRAAKVRAVGVSALYYAVLRRWIPGDELLENVDGVSTRAIQIHAPASAVWPWIAQMGPSPRGGAYTYDWIENLLGFDRHSADKVLPEFQHPELGETFEFGTNRMQLGRVEPERVLAWRSQDGNWFGRSSSSRTDGQTRLISRNRFRLPTRLARIGMIPMEPGSLVMERKMLLGIKLLLGIKQRAERLACANPEPVRRRKYVPPATRRPRRATVG